VIVLKVLAAVAFIIAFFVPLRTFDQILIFIVSVTIGAGCVIASRAVDDDKGGFSPWPPKPDK
jgi:energy-coupling factor transporter transmembrane protein EcfT